MKLKQFFNKILCLKYISAFSLAETLIALLVIAILAVLVVPSMRTDLDERTKISRKNAFDVKLTQGFANMQMHSGLAQNYDTTADFVKAMDKYMKIEKTCDSEHLKNCFASKIMSDEDLVKYYTISLKKSDDINANFDTQTDLVGLVFPDGTTAIIAYNPSPEAKIYNYFDISSDTMKFMAMMYDINGKDGPNIIGEDIYMINTKSEE